MDISEALKTVDFKDERGRHTVPKPAVVALAQTIFDCFITAYPNYVGGAAPVSKKHAIAFYKAALLCLRRKEDPQVFVVKQLRGMAAIGKFFPKLIYSEKVIEACNDGNDVKLDIIRHYKAQLALFDSRCKLYGPLNALTDEANGFSPLFRYIAAREYGMKALAQSFAAAALLELKTTPSAREVFGDDRLKDLGSAPTGTL